MLSSQDDFYLKKIIFSTAPSSLLTSPTTPTTLPIVASGVPNQNNLLGGPTPGGINLFGNVSQPASVDFIGSTPTLNTTKSGNDLLGDLADFGSLSLQSKSTVSNTLNNNNLNDALTGGPGLLDNFGGKCFFF